VRDDGQLGEALAGLLTVLESEPSEKISLPVHQLGTLKRRARHLVTAKQPGFRALSPDENAKPVP